MDMNRNEFDDREAQAAWELLGRHQGIEPSFGFSQRTLRRLHEAPARRFWQMPVWRWAAALTCVVAVAGAGWMLRQRVERQRNAAVYAETHHDSLEDYDVIVALDQLGTGEKS